MLYDLMGSCVSCMSTICVLREVNQDMCGDVRAFCLQPLIDLQGISIRCSRCLAPLSAALEALVHS